MFKVFDEKEKDRNVTLRLVTLGGLVQLAAVDERGHVLQGGYLLTFRNDGTFYRSSGVSAGIRTKTVNGKFEERT